MTPEQIAAKLTPTQKRALLWLRADGGWLCSRGAGRSVDVALQYINPLRERQIRDGAAFYRATDTGLAVRRIIEREEGHG